MRFEWDSYKAASNFRKHRVSFDEAVTVFYDPLTATFGDPDHSDSKAVRGKYYRRLLREGANVAVLDPDVAKAFRNSAAVNEALRSLLKMSEVTRRLTSRPAGRVANARR
jgi:ribonuclease toxin BrnT of type II toxin-antitoxin system